MHVTMKFPINIDAFHRAPHRDQFLDQLIVYVKNARTYTRIHLLILIII